MARLGRGVLVLAAVLIVGYGVAIWAMAATPGFSTGRSDLTFGTALPMVMPVFYLTTLSAGERRCS